jgi:cell division protease FtsH
VELLAPIRDVALTWLPILLLVALVYLMWRAAGAIPRTRAEVVRPDSASSVPWDHVAGLDEAKDELREVVDFLRDPGRFERLGARGPKGVLLYGPPGTGKTLLAKAVAHEAGAAFYAQSASSFVEIFGGAGAARIRQLFKVARKNAPAIVFLDELDAVGGQRGTGLNNERDQTLNQLLVEMDGFVASGRVVVIAASNRIDVLDRALLRPGRFDRQIFVAPPDLAGRKAILAVHTRTKPLAPDADLDLIARQTAGLAGADLENICNEAAIYAGRRRADRIEHGDLDWALERVLTGLASRIAMGDSEKRVVAYHEAGHALVAHLTGRSGGLHRITIVPRGEALGYVLDLPEIERHISTRDELVGEVTMLLGGRAAEEVVFGSVSNGAGNDLERVTALTRSMVFDWGMGETVTSRTIRASDYALSEETKRMRDAEQARIADRAYARAVDMVAEHRDALDRIVTALLASETLDRGEIVELLRDVPAGAESGGAIGAVRARRARG